MTKKHTRGFSLVEAVVAMAVVLIISASTMTMMLSSSRAERRESEHHAATAQLADILTVYRVSDNETEFKENLAFALGLDAATLDLAGLPLVGGYLATVAYGETLAVTVRDDDGRIKEGMGYTFTAKPSGEVAP